MPLLLALAAIRMVVYAMRRLFVSQAWLKTAERAIAFSIWGVAILYFTGVLPELARELDAIRCRSAGRRSRCCRWASGMLAVILTLIVTLWLSGLIEQRLLKATSFDTNTKAVLAKFVRAVLLVVGVLVALQAIGFDLTLLTVFGGALGVGIGLGLQKLAANYIAGFTILLDHSIRLGDLITVDGRHGVVSRVTSRYVVVRSLDGVEAIVPNETLVTTTVLNHSHPAPEVRTSIAVPGRLRQRHRACAQAHGRGRARRTARNGRAEAVRWASSSISAIAASISNWASGCAIRKAARAR